MTEVAPAKPVHRQARRSAAISGRGWGVAARVAPGRRPAWVRPRRVLLRLSLPAALILLWYGATRGAPANPVLPPPQDVLAALWREAVAGTLFVDIGYSLMRAFSGFLLAGTVGLGLGLVMSQWRVARQVLSGPLELLRPISSIAWLPLTILWFGIGFASIVAVIFISCVFIILLNTLAAAMRVEPDLVKAALTLGAGRRAVFWKVVIPSALPGILLGLRIALSGAWGGVLIAELIAAREGLGFMIGRAEASFHPELVIGGMVVIGVVGYLLNALFLLLQRRYIHGHT